MTTDKGQPLRVSFNCVNLLSYSFKTRPS